MALRGIWILFLLMPPLVADNRFGDFHHCRRVDASAVSYNTDERIELCCEINSDTCNGNLSIHHENFGHPNKSCLVTASKKCSINLTISEAKALNAGTYQCFHNEELIGSTPVYVLAKPEPPKVLRKRIKLKKVDHVIITLTFHPGDITIYDNITIFEGDNPRTVRCKNDSIIRVNQKFQCVFDKISLLSGTETNITLVIHKKRLREESEVKESFDPYPFIVPTAVIKLRVVNTSHDSAHIMWCQPNAMKLQLPFMISNKIAFRSELRIFKMEGVCQERFTEIFLPGGHEVHPPYDLHNCVLVKVQHLTPFTKYEAKVTFVTSRYRGKTKVLSFATKEAAPKSPPQGILFWNSYDNTWSMPGSKKIGKRSIFIIWKPIPHDQQGGSIFYKIEIFKEGGDWLSHVDNVKTPYTVIQDVLNSAHLTVRIWAVNNISNSANFSELKITPNAFTDVTNLESHVELQKNRALTYIKMPFSKWRLSGIHWCRGRQHQTLQNLVMCDEFPNVDHSFNESSKQKMGIVKHNVAMIRNSPDCISTRWEEEVSVQHYERPRLGRYEREENVTMNVEKTCGCSRPTFNAGDKRPLKLFMSFTKDDGHPRLFPFSCYYDNGKDEVKLLYKETTNGEKTILNLEQKCDNANPSQYLADTFQVTVSEKRQCKPVIGGVSSLKHDVFSPAEFTLPRRHVYVCVTSTRLTNESRELAYDSHYIGEISGEDKKILIYTVIAVIVLLVAVLSLIACVLFNRNKRRKNGRQEIASHLIRFEDHSYEELLRKQDDPQTVNSDMHTQKDSGLPESVSMTGSSSRQCSTLAETSTDQGESSSNDTEESVDNMLYKLKKKAPR